MNSAREHRKLLKFSKKLDFFISFKNFILKDPSQFKRNINKKNMKAKYN